MHRIPPVKPGRIGEDGCRLFKCDAVLVAIAPGLLEIPREHGNVYTLIRHVRKEVGILDVCPIENYHSNSRLIVFALETAMPVPMDVASLKAKLFRGFADPTRLAILESLLDGERSVGEIAQLTENAVANVSAHLACLTGCGLVRSQRRGKFVYYQLQERRVRDLLKLADAILANVSRQMYECVHAGR